MHARIARVLGAVGVGLLSLPRLVSAHCPACALAVGAGAATASYYGMGAGAVGTFVGGFGIVMGLWTARILKHDHKPVHKTLIVGGTLGLTLLGLGAIPSQTMYAPVSLIGAPGTWLNKVYWLDKALIGAGLGILAALAAHYAHNRLNKSLG
ncbi:MAG: hypothetical protein HY393_02090 [Candidatus Diapherotrites archaeon]|nr:hypothetical protein [Candidatus Diapherotrites archaeon]